MALWRVEEAADYLGIRPKTLYEWVRTGRVPHRKIGFNVRFDPAELQQWAAGQAQGPDPARRADQQRAAGPRRDAGGRDSVAELREAASDAVALLHDLERDAGTHLSFPERRRMTEVAERLAEAVRDLASQD